jgi:hypothetical protein
LVSLSVVVLGADETGADWMTDGDEPLLRVDSIIIT